MGVDLTKFDEYKEDNRREVKKAKDGLPNSLWETYSAFANCYGGVIILGVAENKDGSFRTTGINNPRKFLKEFWDTINNKNKVSLNLLTDKNVETYSEPESGDIILIISVPAASRDQKPIYIDGDMFKGTFRRNWEGDYRCSTQEVRAMLRDEHEITMDMKVLDECPLSYIDKQSVGRYRNRHKAYRPGHPWNNLDYEDYIEQIGAAAISKEDGELHPTAAGLLMFGEEYHIVREFPDYFLDFREMLDPQMRWTDRFISSSGEWTGNLFDFYFIVYNKLIKNIKTPFQIKGGVRVDDTPVHKALREALANCLVNADFYLPRAVVVKVEAEQIIFENPGSVRAGKKQMLKGGISDPRNKALMKMFNLIDIGERAGSGVPNIYSVWEAEGWNQPIVEEQYGPDRTILTLPIVKKPPIKTADKKPPIKTADKKSSMKKRDMQIEQVLSFMQEGREYKSSEISELLGLKENRTREILRNMVSEKLIFMQGSNRNRRYMKVKGDNS